jgi:cell division protein FtsW
MARTLKSDKTLFLLTMLLVGASLVMVYSASYAKAIDDQMSEYHYLYRQMAWAVLGFAAMWVAMHINYRTYRRSEVVWMALGVALVLLFAVLLVGPRINGTRRWFQLGIVSFQPSEIAKLVSVIFTAALLDRRMHRIRDIGGTLMPIVLAVLAMVALVLAGRDFGTSVVIIGVVMAMLFAAGLSYRHLAIAVVPLGIGATIFVALFSYRINRLVAFLDPWKYAAAEGYQVVQSMLAVASGGLLGAGLMNSRQKLLYLPEPHTDFIFAVIAEEFGLIGTTLMLLCFAVIVWRGLRISLLAPDRFGSLLALGITMIIGIQGLINISVALSLLPTKGIALPFVSNGGSSLLLSMVSMGILLNISQHVSATTVAPAKAGTDWTLGAQEA